MSKYKLYFKKPTNIKMPTGEWIPWLPKIILKHIQLVGVFISVISVVIILSLMSIANKNGELTIFLRNLTMNIDSSIIRSLFVASITLILVAAITFVHEILHLIVGVGKGDMFIYWNKSLLGFSPYNDCEFTWGQSFVCKTLPFLILSVGFYIIAQFTSAEIRSLLKWIAIINLGISTGDLLLTPCMFLIPRGAIFYGGCWQVRYLKQRSVKESKYTD